MTICTALRACLLGEIVGDEMRLNALGQIVREEWFRTAALRRDVRLNSEEFVVMPNHVHGIIWIVPCSGAGATSRSPLRTAGPGPGSGSLGAIIAGFKSAVAIRANQLLATPGKPFWQRNYYEHVIRGGEDLALIQRYISENPSRWAYDRNNPRPSNPALEEPL